MASKGIKLTREEKAFIRAINSLLESGSPSVQLVQVMVGIAEESIESGSLILNPHNVEFLSHFSQSPDVQMILEHRRNPRRCPECNNRLRSFCGKFTCYSDICKSMDFFVEGETAKKQCPGCISFRDVRDPKYETRLHQGFGKGCPGVFERGDEIILYEELKIHGMTPRIWKAGVRNVDDLLIYLRKQREEQDQDAKR